MKPIIRRPAGILAACILIFFSPLYAQERQNTDNSEVNYVREGEKWTQEAFNARMNESAAYPGWLNREGMLDRDEFTTEIFRRWDSNRDRYLDDEEYDAGNIRWAEEFGDNFEAYDQDEDERLSAEEFGAGMDETGIYDTWDLGGEGYLTEEEFGEGLFNTLDADEDGNLGEGEFGETDYDTWFDTDVEGGATGTDTGAGGATGTDIESGTELDTETGTDTDIGTGTDVGTGTDIGTETGTGTGTDTGGDIDY